MWNDEFSTYRPIFYMRKHIIHKKSRNFSWGDFNFSFSCPNIQHYLQKYKFVTTKLDISRKILIFLFYDSEMLNCSIFTAPNTHSTTKKTDWQNIYVNFIDQQHCTEVIVSKLGPFRIFLSNRVSILLSAMALKWSKFTFCFCVVWFRLLGRKNVVCVVSGICDMKATKGNWSNTMYFTFITNYSTPHKKKTTNIHCSLCPHCTHYYLNLKEYCTNVPSDTL